MNIRMYDCRFGDCFLLSGDNKYPLMVDCGIHKNSENIISESRYRRIYRDIHDKKVDFLLTHYHEDHYAGAIFIAKNRDYRFNRVFIPDIWSDEDFIPAIELELLRQILDGAYRLKSEVTLIDFLSLICEESSFVSFIKRGNYIGEKYIALWPTKDFVVSKSNQILKRLSNSMKDETFYEELHAVSLELQQIVYDMRSDEDNRPQNIGVRLAEVRSSIEKLANRVPQDKSKHFLRLQEYGNEISIVFQNDSERNNSNILFTGDFGKTRNWKYLERDKKPEMYEQYAVIKAPHHGTEPYYYPFSNRLKGTGVLLIPNGENSSDWEVDVRYIDESAKGKYIIMCSHGRGCCACGRCSYGCNGIKIYPRIYRDIELL